MFSNMYHSLKWAEWKILNTKAIIKYIYTSVSAIWYWCTVTIFPKSCIILVPQLRNRLIYSFIKFCRFISFLKKPTNCEDIRMDLRVIPIISDRYPESILLVIPAELMRFLWLSTRHGIEGGSNVDLPDKYTTLKLPPILDYCSRLFDMETCFIW